MTYVDFEEVVSESISIIGASGDDELAKNFARQWIWRGLQRTGTSEEDSLEDTKVYAKNLLIKKPKMKRLESIALYDANDCYIPHIFHSGKRIHPNTEQWVVTTTEGEEVFGPVDLSENRDSFVIGTNGSHVAYALVRYWGYPLDAGGMPRVREDEVEALTLYVRYKWSQRKNENQSEIRENKIAWMEACDWAIAQKKITNGEQKKRMAADLNRMIPNFNRSRN